LGEGWAVGRFPGQFLRRTELIKRSLRLDDEPTWWCLEPLQLSALKKDRMASRPTASGLVKLIGRNYDSTRIVA